MLIYPFVGFWKKSSAKINTLISSSEENYPSCGTN